MPTEHDCRGVHPPQQPPCALRHPLRTALHPGEPRPPGGVGQGEKVPTLIVVELERVGERVQDSVGRSYLATLLHPLATVPRVVSLGSITHRSAHLDFEDLMSERDYRANLTSRAWEHRGRLGRVIAWLGLFATQSAGSVD